MAGIVLADKDGRFDCSACMDPARYMNKAQGRGHEYAEKRILSNMKRQGCQEPVREVLRLDDGTRITRCPRAIVNALDGTMFFSQHVAMQNGITVGADSRPYKWHQIMAAVRVEWHRLTEKKAGN